LKFSALITGEKAKGRYMECKQVRRIEMYIGQLGNQCHEHHKQYTFSIGGMFQKKLC
jgi:hypothetical protein